MNQLSASLNRKPQAELAESFTSMSKIITPIWFKPAPLHQTHLLDVLLI